MEVLKNSHPFVQARQFYARYEKYFPAGFFVGGFLFDIVTLSRIDSLATIGQQAAYLIILGLMLFQMLRETAAGQPVWPNWQWYGNWRIPIMHFIFGSLLSSYTLFFFMSASLATSFVFLIVIATLLVVNELPRFQNLGLSFKFALFGLCTMSYFAYVLPTLVGRTGTLVFLVSVFAGFVPAFLIYRRFHKHPDQEFKARTQVLRPALLVLAGFLASYLLAIIPPVPLSLQYLGIYHGVKRNAEGKFELAHERPWWRFWHNGDQWFRAQPEDRIIAFFRLFSPTNFSDDVRVVWYLDVPGRGWQVQDKIPIRIVGGRDEGFRGYAQKSNYTAGRWRVAVETSDGREIGRLGFRVDVIPTSPREFHTDQF